MLHQDRIQSWLVDIPDLLLPLDSRCREHAVARADSPLLGFETPSNHKPFPSRAVHCAEHVRELSLDKPLPARPSRTPSPPTPTLTSGNSSVTSSPNSDYPGPEYSPVHSRSSSIASAIFTGGHSPSPSRVSRGVSLSVCAGHETLSRQGSSGSSSRGSVLRLVPPPSRRLSQSRRSVSSRSLRQVSASDRTLTRLSSVDNLKNANRASVRNAVYIDGDEVERRLGELVLLQSSSIPEEASTSSVSPGLNASPPSPKIKRKSSLSGNSNNSTVTRSRPRGDSFTPEFTFPFTRSSLYSPSQDSGHSTTPTATTPLPPATPPATPAFDDFLSVDSDTEPDVASTPTKKSKRQSTRQRLASFISKITSSTASSSPTRTSPTHPYPALPSSPSSPAFHSPAFHNSTPSSSTASSYDYFNSTLSLGSFSQPIEVDPFAKVPVEIVTPTVVVTPTSPSLPSSPKSAPPLKRTRAVSLTSGTSFGTSRAAKAARDAKVPDLPVLDISRHGIVDLTHSPSPTPPATSKELSFSLPTTAVSTPSPLSSETVPSPTTPSKFSKFKSPFSSSSKNLPLLTSPSTPNLKKAPLHKRLSLNPILLPRTSSHSTSGKPNGGVLDYMMFR